MKRIIIAITVSLVTTTASAGVFSENQETAGRQQLAANSSGAVVLNASSCESKGAKLPPAEKVVFMKSCLAEASSQANVKAVALQQKKAYCDKNAKNKALQGNAKESYLSACMNHNEAQVQYALSNPGMAPKNTDTAVTDYDKAMQKSPPAAGNK